MRKNRAAIALVIVAVPFMLLLLLVRDKWKPLLRLDLSVSGGLHRYALDHSWFVTVMKTLSTLGSGWVWFAIFTAVTGYLVWRRMPRLALFVAVTTAASAGLNELVKAAVNRARPVLPEPVASASGLSFPSGHAQAAIVGFLVLLLVFLPTLHGVWRALAITFAVVMVAAIGLSRVALGVHYVSDVVAGYLLGAAWVAAMIAVFNTWRVTRASSTAAASARRPPR